MTGRLASNGAVGEVAVDGVEAGQHVGEGVRSDGHHQGEADGRVVRVAAAHPVPEAEHVVRVDPELGDPGLVGGHGHEVTGHCLVTGAEPVEQPLPSGRGVGQRLQGGEGLRAHHEQRGRPGRGRGSCGTRSTGSTLETNRQLDVRGRVVEQRLVGHGRAEVRAADPDVDHGRDCVGRCDRSIRRTRIRDGHHRHAVEDTGAHRPPRRGRRPRGGSRGACAAPRGARPRSSVVLMCSAGEHGVAARLHAEPDGPRPASDDEGLGGRPGAWSSRGAGRPTASVMVGPRSGSSANSSRRCRWRTIRVVLRQTTPFVGGRRCPPRVSRSASMRSSIRGGSTVIAASDAGRRAALGRRLRPRQQKITDRLPFRDTAIASRSPGLRRVHGDGGDTATSGATSAPPRAHGRTVRRSARPVPGRGPRRLSRQLSAHGIGGTLRASGSCRGRSDRTPSGGDARALLRCRRCGVTVALLAFREAENGALPPDGAPDRPDHRRRRRVRVIRSPPPSRSRASTW